MNNFSKKEFVAWLFGVLLVLEFAVFCVRVIKADYCHCPCDTVQRGK